MSELKCGMEGTPEYLGCPATESGINTVQIEAGRKACELCFPLIHAKSLEIQADNANKIAELEKIARYDFVTDLPNRYYFEEIIEQYIRIIEEPRADIDVGLINIDLVNFGRNTNNVKGRGHSVGDNILRLAGETFTGARESDITISMAKSRQSVAYRLGGDEFAVLQVFDKTKEGKREKREPEVRLFDSAKYFVDRFYNHEDVKAINEGVARKDHLGARAGIAMCRRGDTSATVRQRSDPKDQKVYTTEV